MVKRALLGIALLLTVIVAGLALHVALATGDTVFSWKRPGNLGVKDGKLADVFVWIKDGLPENGNYPRRSDEVMLDQRGCIYHPLTLALQVDQKLTIKNSDPTLHNVHAYQAGATFSNQAQPPSARPLTKKLPAAATVLQFKCDVHPWMQVYLGVVDHPYFRVTGPDGTFRLADVPAGDYVVGAWHERFGTREARVTLAAGETKDLAFSFGGTGAGGN